MIYSLKNSEEAEEFGKQATPEQAEELEKAAKIYRAQYAQEKASGGLDINKANRLMVIEKHFQMCDEALSAYHIQKAVE